MLSRRKRWCGVVKDKRRCGVVKEKEMMWCCQREREDVVLLKIRGDVALSRRKR